MCVKYYCISCGIFKFQKESLKSWHGNHRECKISEVNNETINLIFREELQSLRNRELNESISNIIESSKDVTTLSESSSDEDDIVGESVDVNNSNSNVESVKSNAKTISETNVQTSSETSLESNAILNKDASEESKVQNKSTQTDVSPIRLQNDSNNIHPSIINARDELLKSNRRYKDENFNLKSNLNDLKKQVEEYSRKKTYIDNTIHEFKKLEIDVEQHKKENKNLLDHTKVLEARLDKLQQEIKETKNDNMLLTNKIKDYETCVSHRRYNIHVPMRNDLVIAQPLNFEEGMEEMCFKDKKRGVSCKHFQMLTDNSGRLQHFVHKPPYRKKRKFEHMN